MFVVQKLFFKGLDIGNPSLFPARFEYFCRIKMHILNDAMQITIRVYVFGAERLNHEIPYPIMPTVKVRGVRGAELMHEGGNSSLFFLLEHQMRMVVHQTKRSHGNKRVSSGKHKDIRIRNIFQELKIDVIRSICKIQELLESLKVVGIIKNIPLINTAVVHVIPLFRRERFSSISHTSSLPRVKRKATPFF